MEGTKILSALLPMAIALAAGTSEADAQTTPMDGHTSGFSAYSDHVRVNVENPNRTEVRVYVAVRGGYIPIGNAPRMSTATFSIPRALLRGSTSVMLLAHPASQNRNTVARRVMLTPAGLATWSITGLATPQLRRAQA